MSIHHIQQAFALKAKTRHAAAVLTQSDWIWALNACMAHFGPLLVLLCQTYPSLYLHTSDE